MLAATGEAAAVSLKPEPSTPGAGQDVDRQSLAQAGRQRQAQRARMAEQGEMTVRYYEGQEGGQGRRRRKKKQQENRIYGGCAIISNGEIRKK